MKRFFAASFLGLTLLSLAAWWTRPRPVHDGKTEILLVADPSPVRQAQVDAFNQISKDVLVNIDPVNTDMQKVIVQSLGGVGPDVFSCYDSFSLSAYVKSGIALDCTDELRKMGVDLEKDVWKSAFSTFMFEGRAFGFSSNVTADAVWYNKALLEAAGVPYPSGSMKWEEFIPIAQKLTKRDASGRVITYGFLFDPIAQWIQFVMQFGGHLYTPDGTRCIVDSPEGIAAAQLMHDLMFKYKVTPTLGDINAMSTSGGWGGDINVFANRRSAMALGGRWWLASLRNEKDLRLGAFECPHAKLRVFRGYGKGYLVNKKSAHLKEALEYIQFLTGAEYNRLINHQADALAPMKKFAYEELFLHDPAYPHEDFNEVWRTALEHSEPEQISPFMNGAVLTNICIRQMELLKSGEKSPQEVMRTIAQRVNQEIAKTVESDPKLGERYTRLTGKKVGK